MPLAGSQLAACREMQALLSRAAPCPWIPAPGDARACPSLGQRSLLLLLESQQVAGPSGWQVCPEA